jgi:predicted nucleotidyltransferase
MELEELLASKVDVISENGLSPYLKNNILAEAIPL